MALDKERNKIRKQLLKDAEALLAYSKDAAATFFATTSPTVEEVGVVADALRGEEDPEEGMADLEGAREVARKVWGRKDVTAAEVAQAWSEAFEDAGDEEFEGDEE